MDTYKITKAATSYYKNFASLEAAQTFADSLGEGYTATLTPENEQIQAVTGAERLSLDKAFGVSLIDDFNLMNRAANLDQGNPMPLATTRLVNAKFEELKIFLLVGDIEQSKEALAEMQVDLLLPIELKNLFLNKIDTYLAQYL